MTKTSRLCVAARLVALSGILLAAGSCRRVAEHSPATARDPIDLGSTDRTREDQARPDVAADVGRDMPGPSDNDMFVDKGVVDAWTAELSTAADLGIPDAAPDAPASDLLVKDAAPSAACGAGAAVRQIYDPKMVMCTGSIGLYQCQAESHCATGWHLCDLDEYSSRGGASTPPAEKGAWISGCVRDGQLAPPSVLNVPCMCISNGSGPGMDLAWSCTVSQPQLTTNQRHMGVATFDKCSQLGSAASGKQAYWMPRGSTNKAVSALCCL